MAKGNIKERMAALAGKVATKSDQEIEEFDQQIKSAQEQMVSSSVKPAKRHIAKHASKPEQQFFSFMPTQMTRTSPFFPMSKRQMKDRPIERGLTWETPWGRLTVSGERLSVYDETVLLSLLAIMVKHQSDTFETTQHQLCQISNVKPATNTYNAIWGSIDRLAGTKIRLEIWEGKGKSRKAIRKMTGSIISFADWSDKSGKLKIALNPYFTQMYAEGFLTNLKLEFRAKLKGDTTKALYRFFQGQEPFYKHGKFEIHLLKLCRAINLKTDNVELRRLREQIRKGLRELRKHGYLSFNRINKHDRVMVRKGQPKSLNK